MRSVLKSWGRAARWGILILGVGVASVHAAEWSSPLLGRWAVDTARLPMPPAARPKSVTLAFAGTPEGRLRMTVDVVDPSGATLHAEGVTPLDGTATAVPDNFEADMSATTLPQPHVLVVQLAKGGVPASTRIYTVAADGRTMTEVVAHFSAEGRPVLRHNHFHRLP